jgi:GTPase SAR1 family protein
MTDSPVIKETQEASLGRTSAVGGDQTASSRTIAVIDRLTQLAQDFELPAPSNELERFRERLESNQFQVLVIGEAKRGKSTFINALIGRDILPTDVDIATSQVFRVSRADSEAYRLRFEDGSLREIDLSDLALYGSQVVADAHGQPKLDETIRWIEVDVPAGFIPPNLSILDTPGLGAVYAAHAQITYRYLPHADAVIFVLDSGQPIGAAEIELVDRILSVTRHIFFIQTKIDEHSRDSWEERGARSETVLREHFGDGLGDCRIWPISSKNLRKAASSTHPDALLIVSRYQALASALEDFLLKMSASERAAQAVAVTSRYQVDCRRVLSNRLHALESPSTQALTEETGRVAAERKRFEAEWGARGPKRLELVNEIRRIASIGRQAFRETLQPSGKIVRPLERKIDKLGVTEATTEFGQHLLEELIDASLKEWESVRRMTEVRSAELLSSFLEVSEHVGIKAKWEADAIARAKVEAHGSGYDKLMMTYAAMSPLLMLSTYLVPVMMVPLGALMFLGSRARAKKEEFRRLLRQQVQDLLQHFFSVNISDAKISRIDEYFKTVESTVTDIVDTTVKRRLSGLHSEIIRLHDQVQMDQQARSREADSVRRQLSDWDAVGNEIIGLAKSDELRPAIDEMINQDRKYARSESPEPAVSRS